MPPLKKKRKGRTQYYSADAFEQQRLNKLIASVAAGSGSFPSGYGSGAYGTAPFSSIPSGLVSGGGVTDHIEMVIDTTTTFSPLTFNSVYQNIGSVFSWGGSDRVFCSTSGIFSFVVNMSLSMKTTQGAISIAFRVKRTSDNVTLYTLSYQDRNPTMSATYPKTLVNSLLNVKINAPFYLEFTLVNSATTITNFSGFVTITKLG